MFNIIARANNMLKTVPSAYSEILYEFKSDYKIGKHSIPDIEEILAFTGDVPETDVISVSFSDGTTSVTVNTNGWTEAYKEFVNSLYDSDEVTAFIKIEKNTYIRHYL